MAQKNKLQLAGRGDMKRFLDRVEEKRSLYKGLKVDQIKIGEIYQQIQPLKSTLSSGLFGEGSIFFKSIGMTLTAEQLARHERTASGKEGVYLPGQDRFVGREIENSLAMSSEQANGS